MARQVSQGKRICAFNNFPEFPCHAEDAAYFELINTCAPGEYGRKCGSYVVQKLITETLDITDLSSTLDETFGMVVGRAEVIKTPQGDVSESTRESIVGAWLPLRENRATDMGAVAVAHVDLVLTLMQATKMAAANDYNRYRFNAAVAGATFDWWHFKPDEVTITNFAHPVTTMNSYDDTFDIHGPAAGNSHATNFGLARIANVDFRPSIAERFGVRGNADESSEVSE